jgi:hypothetical protein
MPEPTPFQAGPEVASRGALARFFRVGAKSSAQQELVNLFARSPLSDVTPEVVSRVLEQHKVRTAGARELLRDLWRQALVEFIKDDVLTDEEVTYLADLRRVLTLSETESETILDQAVTARYGKELSEAVADGKVSPEEQDRLERLVVGLRLSKETRAKLNQLQVDKFAGEHAKILAADHRVSTQELQQLEELGAALGVTDIQLDKATKATLARSYQLWLIENGQPPAIPIDIALQKGEEAYFTTSARWAELRTKTVKVTYSGSTASIRIMKGVRWRVGSITPHRVTQEQLTLLDAGRLYITNKRVMFRGSKKNVALPLSSLIAIRVFSDCIQFEKATAAALLHYLRGISNSPRSS